MPRSPRILVFCILVASLAAADARPRHRRHSGNPIAVALQPFRELHNAVHAIAEPLVTAAPRAIAAVAAEPLRVAFYAPRAIRVDRDVIRGGPADDSYYNEADAAPERDEQADPTVESRGSHPTVAGSRAVLRDGVAYAPSRAPQNVKNAIWAVNTIRRRPYAYGGGHRSFNDNGYDCSGTVSFALYHAGALGAPLGSTELQGYGDRGRGRWFTIYARSGHAFAEIAGLRLDTTDFRRGGDVGPRWHEDFRDTRGFIARHPAGL